MFIQLNEQIKTTLRNRLSTQILEAQLRIAEEGCPLADFKADEALECWLSRKRRRLTGAKLRNYPAERQSTAASSSAKVIDIAAATLSDLEGNEVMNVMICKVEACIVKLQNLSLYNSISILVKF